MLSTKDVVSDLDDADNQLIMTLVQDCSAFVYSLCSRSRLPTLRPCGFHGLREIPRPIAQRPILACFERRHVDELRADAQSGGARRDVFADRGKGDTPGGKHLDLRKRSAKGS
jgi:hypothetical protein